MTRRKDGTYQEQVTLKGQKKPKYFYGKTQSEVHKKMAAYKGEVIKGRLFSVVADKWEEEHDEKIAYKTKSCYNAPYKNIVDEFGTQYINTITSQELNLFIIKVSKKGFSLRTVKAYITVLNMIFNYALLNADVLYSPVVPVKPPKGLRTSKRDMPNQADIEKIKSGTAATFGMFAYFLLYTGCRRGEALALEYGDVDYDNKIIKIYKSLHYEGNKPVIKEPKTEAGKRDIILLDRLADKLPKGKGYIFANGRKLISGTRFETLWKAYCKEIGLTKAKTVKDKKQKEKIKIVPSITPHQLRHAYATILYEAGVDEKAAQDLLGHSTIALTRDIYTHISKTKKEKTAKLLNDFDG